MTTNAKTGLLAHVAHVSKRDLVACLVGGKTVSEHLELLRIQAGLLATEDAAKEAIQKFGFAPVDIGGCHLMLVKQRSQSGAEVTFRFSGLAHSFSIRQETFSDATGKWRGE